MLKKLGGFMMLKRFLDRRPHLKGRLRRGARGAMRPDKTGAGSTPATPSDPTYGIRR